MKFAAEVDRRNARSHYDNLVVEVGGAIGKIDAKAEMLAEHLEERLDSMEGRLGNFPSSWEVESTTSRSIWRAGSTTSASSWGSGSIASTRC
jgi:hypothetical protein